MSRDDKYVVVQAKQELEEIFSKIENIKQDVDNCLGAVSLSLDFTDFLYNIDCAIVSAGNIIICFEKSNI